MTRKYINEHYFDKESRAMYYVLGALYSRNVLLEPTQGFRFISTNEDLVEIVRRELESEHKITQHQKSGPSYKLEIDNLPYMYSRLEELGLAVPKNQRGFPDIKEEYLPHFIRGFLDAKSDVARVKRFQRTNVTICFNHPFLLALYQKLQEYVGIMHSEPLGTRMHLGHSDSVNLYHFIYGDWDFIRENGLYLPSKKDSYTPEYNLHGPPPNVLERMRRIEMAKQLLLDGQMPTMFYKELGYFHLTSFYRAFREVTGLSPTEWRLDLKLLELSKEFKEVTRISATEWLAAQRAEGWKTIDF